MGNADIGRIELDPRQRNHGAQCRCHDKYRRNVKIEPADPAFDEERLAQHQIAIVDQVSGPARVVKGVPDVVKTVKDIDCVGEKRDEGDGDRGAGRDDQRQRTARQQSAADRRAEGNASAHADRYRGRAAAAGIL